MKRYNEKPKGRKGVSFYHEKLKNDMEFRGQVLGICMGYDSPVAITAKNRKEIEMVGYVLRVLGSGADMSFVRGVSSNGEATYTIKRRGSGNNKSLPRDEIYKKLLEVILTEYVLLTPSDRK